LVALAAGILGHVDPITSVWRAAIALVLGWVGANLWYVLTTGGRSAVEDNSSTDQAGESEAA